MSERDVGEGDLECGGIMEEYKIELSYVCQKMAQAIVWQLGRLCRSYAPIPSEQRHKAMRIGRGAHICLHQVMRTVKRMHKREEERILETLG